jgi:hypothetical protein
MGFFRLTICVSGYFTPRESETPLWDLENDYYLHNLHVRYGGHMAQQTYLAKARAEQSDEEDEERDGGGGPKLLSPVLPPPTPNSAPPLLPSPEELPSPPGKGSGSSSSCPYDVMPLLDCAIRY